MNKYQIIFSKYRNIGNQEVSSYNELVNIVMDNLNSYDNSNSISNAIIMLGFSGNGKTTWINNFIAANPDYKVVSMDAVVKKIYSETGHKVNGEDIIKSFGDELELHCSNGDKIIIDGNFLNLLTRCAVIDTLHAYNYNINLVDLTPIINSVLLNRIFDKTSEDLNILITRDNYELYLNNPIFQKRVKEILNYYQYECQRSSIDLQKQLDIVSLGVNKVFACDTDYSDISLLNITSKKNS